MQPQVSVLWFAVILACVYHICVAGNATAAAGAGAASSAAPEEASFAPFKVTLQPPTDDDPRYPFRVHIASDVRAAVFIVPTFLH